MNTGKALPKIKQSGVIQIRGKDVMACDRKLDYTHQLGMKSLQVKILQFPSELNGQMCFCQAEFITADDRVFSDIAEALPHNVPRGCADSFPRISFTRAKSRVILDAFNIKSVVNEDADMPPDGGGGEHIIDADFSAVESMRTQASPATYDGGGAKPASDKQLALITRIVENRGGSPEDMSIEMCGKSLDKLQGKEANTIIKHLTKK